MAFLVLVLLICLPLLAAAILAIVKDNAVRKAIVILFVSALIALALILAIFHFNVIEKFYIVNAEWVNVVLLAAEVLVALYIVYVSIKSKKPLIVLLTVLQTAALLWFEFSGTHTSAAMDHHLFVDKLNIIMAVIVAIVGGMIAIYALSYMDKYHEHHKDVPDRRRLFFAVIFLFFSAMYGIIFSNDLTWIFLFWEITTISSFLLIGYSQTEEAKRNSFTALLYNIIGSVFFAGGIIYFGLAFNATQLHEILTLSKDNPAVAIAAFFIAIAGLAKSAQMPFSKWLLGAMVAPTPTSALLHSSTMVKAGVYLILRVSPLVMGNVSGLFIVLVGGVTFLWASFIAITQNDGKKVLAYSTIANLGLIVACAGIGTYEAIWAALFLIIFHAVSKSLMFLSVGSVENLMGSRDIEDMHGLIVKLPTMAIFMTVGIAGMFLAPFGMLISKWAAMKAFVDSKNMIMLFMLVFGSAATLFYWTKWLGKIVALRHKSERLHVTVPFAEKFSLSVHSALTVLVCLTFPLISQYIVEPFLVQMFGATQTIIGAGNQQIMLMLLGMILLLPVGLSFLTRNAKLTTVYMGGINEGDDRHFKGAGGESKRMYLSNWYMERYFGEGKLFRIGTILAAALLVSGIIYQLGRIL
jgi:ech hydrogenase subunit A